MISGDTLFGFDGDWWKLGVCSICDKELIEAARAFIMEHGIKVPPTEVPGVKPAAPKAKKTGIPAGPPESVLNPNRQAPVNCIWCDYGGTIAALNVHVKRHGFHGFRDAFGTRCPMCGEDGFTLMGRHARVHDAADVTDLFQQAIKLGDLHGVVADRLKAAA